MSLEQKIVNLVADIEDILENTKDIYTNNIMKEDFIENYWNYRSYLGGEELEELFWNGNLIEAIESFATDRITDNRNSCNMKKKDIIKNEMKIYDCWKLAELSVKSKELYDLFCSLETKENTKVYVKYVKQVDFKEKIYQFYYAKTDSCDNIN